jgi:hypothetical protein
MNKATLLTLLFASLFTTAIQAQTFLQLGTPFVEDQGRRMIATSDGGYITAGSAGAKAVLYKTDCLGNLVAQIEKTLIPGPAVFWDVIELSDGNIVAVGGATLTAPADTGSKVFLLKTTSMLVETATAAFNILGKEALGKSIAQTSTGNLIIWGEVTGASIDFTDAFFQRVSPTTLQPTAAPVIFNNGVDLASRILPTADGNYLLSGSSFSGNIFNPDAPIDNNLRAYKVDENGTLLWLATVNQVFPAKYGVATACGAGQSIESGNFVLGGTLYGGTDAKKQDAFFALISNNGTVLDTAYADGQGQQKMNAIAENTAFPGLYAMVGETDGSPLGVPAIVFSQAYELGGVLYSQPAEIDVDNPVSLRDLAEIDAGRFAFMATLPDNPVVLGAMDIILVTPEATVGVVYQNCALAATLSTPAVAFQWLFEGQPIQGANQGVYFPTKPGLYEVQILDDKGCFGVSDTFRVEGPMADFTASPNLLATTFTNTSEGAISYAWNFGDGGTSTQANPMHTYAATGVYSVRLIATNACGLKDTIVQQIGVTPSEEPSWLDYFSLAPNPTNGVFTVEMNGSPQTEIAFTIFNMVGQKVSQEAGSFQNGFLLKTFDLGNLPGGVYVLQIQSGKQAKKVCVLKQ